MERTGKAVMDWIEPDQNGRDGTGKAVAEKKGADRS